MNANPDQAVARTLFVSLLPKLSELTKRKNDAQKEIDRVEKERVKCVFRKGDAEKRLAEIGAEYAKLREERRAHLLAERDKEAEAIEKDLARLESEEKRIKELQAGLARVIDEIKTTFGPRASEALKSAERDIGTMELFQLYDEYNIAAEALAVIVRGIFEKRQELGLSARAWPEANVSPYDNAAGALKFIPRLRPACDCTKDPAPVCPGHNPVKKHVSHFWADTSLLPSGGIPSHE